MVLYLGVVLTSDQLVLLSMVLYLGVVLVSLVVNGTLFRSGTS